MEGKGMTAEQSSSPGENGDQGDQGDQGEQGNQGEQGETHAHGGEWTPPTGASSPAPGNEPGMSEQPSSGRAVPRSPWGTPGEPAAASGTQWERPRVRVDG